jgi:hypothetical protein
MQVRRQIDTSTGVNAAAHPRAGASTLDYILILCVVFPLAAFAIPAGKRIIELSYEMMCTMFAWPFM